jgi:hypothetical protein
MATGPRRVDRAGDGVSLAGAGLAGTPRGVHGAGSHQLARNACLRTRGGAPTNNHTPDDGDLADQAAQYDFERTAPAASVSGQALVSAAQQAAALPQAGGGGRSHHRAVQRSAEQLRRSVLVQHRGRLLARRRAAMRLPPCPRPTAARSFTPHGSAAAATPARHSARASPPTTADLAPGEHDRAAGPLHFRRHRGPA